MSRSPLRQERDRQRLINTTAGGSIQSVPLGLIIVDDASRRPLDPDKVEKLAESILEVGLLHPIVLRPVTLEDEAKFRLVAGWHRLEAFRSLAGADEKTFGAIPATLIKDVTGDRIAEIAENLHRAELSALEHAELTAEWGRLVAEKAVSRQVDAKPQGGRPEGGVSAAARAMGIPESELRRANKMAGLDPAAKEAARAMGLDDSQAALLAVAGVSADQQVAAVRDEAEKARLKRRGDRKTTKKSNRSSPAEVRAAGLVAGAIVLHVPREHLADVRKNLKAARSVSAIIAAIDALMAVNSPPPPRNDDEPGRVGETAKGHVSALVAGAYEGGSGA